MHIALVSPGYPPTSGGVERHVGRIAGGLAASGHRVEVFAGRHGQRRAVSRRVGDVEVHTYPAWRLSAISMAPRVVVAARRDRRRFDLVHVHSVHASSGLGAAVVGDMPLVLTPHYHGGGHSPLAVALHRGYGPLQRRAFAAADAVICVSHAEERQVAADFGATAGRTTVIPNGVDVEALRAARPFPAGPAGPTGLAGPTVLAVGRLESYKRVDVLLEAMTTVGDAQLVVVGRGPQHDALRARAERLGIGSRVRLSGDVEDAELHRWYATATVVVSLSGHEAFGMVPLEAAVAGARVVLSDIPAHRELVDRFLGPAAELVEPRPRDVAAAIGRALAAPPPGPATGVPDWEQVALRTEAVYQEVVDAHPR